MPRTRRAAEEAAAVASASAQLQMEGMPPAPAPTPQPSPEPTLKSRKELGGKREPKNVRARMADAVIRIAVDENPRREGTQAHAHFEKMRGGITIREYLSKFDASEQRVARQWLWNTIQDGFVKTVGG